MNQFRSRMKHAGTFKQFVTASINILNAVIINNELRNQTSSYNCHRKMKLHETFHYSQKPAVTFFWRPMHCSA